MMIEVWIFMEEGCDTVSLYAIRDGDEGVEIPQDLYDRFKAAEKEWREVNREVLKSYRAHIKHI